MDFYIPLILYILIVSTLFRKKKWISIVLTIVPLVLFWGTKVNFGSDYFTYQFWYDRRHEMSVNEFLLDALEGKFEPGFFFLLKLMPSFNALVFLQATFLIISVYIFFNEFIPHYSLPLALFLWLYNSSIFNTFSAMRSSFVIGFFLLAIVAKTRFHYKASVLLTLAGASFHMSGYLLLLFTILPFDFFKKNRSVLLPIIFSFIIIALLLSSFFSGLLFYVIEVSDQAASYDYVKEANYGMGFYIYSFVRIGFILYILSLIKRNLIEDRYIWIAWLTIICYLLMMIQIDIMYRFFNYLFLFTVAFKCYVLKIDRSSASKIYVGLSIGYALYNLIEYANGRMMEFYAHYHSFLFQ